MPPKMKRKRPTKEEVDEDPSMLSSDEEEITKLSKEEEETDPFASETPDERRIRLAKEYIDTLQEKMLEEASEDEDPEAMIAKRLKEDEVPYLFPYNRMNCF